MGQSDARPARLANFIQGASKVSLSSLSSQELWERTGRLKGGSEVCATHTCSVSKSNIHVSCRFSSSMIEKNLASYLHLRTKKRSLH